MTRAYLIVVVVMLAAAGCGSGNDHGQDFGNLIASAQGVQVTQAEHPDGWRKSECFTCHPVEEIHQVDRSGTGTLPLADIRAFVAKDGLASCHNCHGSNGLDQ